MEGRANYCRAQLVGSQLNVMDIKIKKSASQTVGLSHIQGSVSPRIFFQGGGVSGGRSPETSVAERACYGYVV